MESDIPSSFDVKVYRPTLKEFENFAELLERIDRECHNDCFAKVSVYQCVSFFVYFSQFLCSNHQYSLFLLAVLRSIISDFV